ncbi:hypothetical protein ASF88_12760 [Leifsonia sp. Leaf336]|uniref:hypothetical protein n=1 Tax=Leifsonia sp. Leaf336 TaxID=1736341 RepID=UPI0006F42EEE|nr:hypothetical protein [Leifsonia sp. Leaf336]KQR52406.1 hypothetical protein ASF88_12760 [Leifsonia sp. Leaf336]
MGTQPLRIGPFARRLLERRARQDAEAARPPRDALSEPVPADSTPAVATPTITALQARANAYARREEQRFFARCRRDLAEQRGLAQALAADLDAYDDRLEALAPAERTASRIAEGDGVAYQELRRLRRRIAQRNARAEQLGASINARFTAARLRASRHFDRSDEKIAVYWSAYLRALTPPAGAVRAPALHRADSLAGRETSVDIWRPVEPVGSGRPAGVWASAPSTPSVEPGSPDART